MKKIMVYGDSNTWGHNPNENDPINGFPKRYEDHVRWASVMQDELGNDYQVLEQGFCGRTTVFDDPLGSNRNGLTSLEVCFRTCDPVDLIIIMLGTNDQKDVFGTDPMCIYYGLERLINQLKVYMRDSLSYNAKIMIVNPARLSACADGSFVYGFTQKSVDMADGIRERYKVLAKEQGCEFFDADAVEGVVVDKADGTHLTKQAHKNLGIAIAKKVREIM